MDRDDEFTPRVLDYHTAHRGKRKEGIAKRVTGALASIAFGAMAILDVVDPSGELHHLGDRRRLILMVIECIATAFCLLVAMGRIR